MHETVEVAWPILCLAQGHHLVHEAGRRVDVQARQGFLEGGPTPAR
jgi:hypothetical protein